MNDEIDLILTKLKIVSEEQEQGMYLCDKKHSKLLLDYITNLQKENERLKKQISNSLKLCENLIKEKDKLYNHLCLEMRKDDKKIIQKAIEYIDNKVLSNGEVIDQLRIIEVEKLLNILNGGDE